MSRPKWDDQFAETAAEKQQRLRASREKRLPDAQGGIDRYENLQAKFTARLRTLVLDFKQAGLEVGDMAGIMTTVEMGLLSGDE